MRPFLFSGLVFLFCFSAAADPLKTGVILPLSGAEARQGELGRQGVELALAGERGRLDVIIEDSQSDAAKAVSAYRKLVNENGARAIAVFGSPSAVALSSLANRDKVPLLALASAAAYSSPDDYTFRVLGSARQEAEFFTEFLGGKRRLKKVALLYSENDYGEGFRREFSRLFKNRGSVLEEGFSPGSGDFRTQLLRLKTWDPEATILAAWSADAANILRQASQLRIAAGSFIGTAACHNPDLITAAGDVAQGLQVVVPNDVVSGPIQQLYRQHYRDEPSHAVWRMYDALKILGEVSRSCPPPQSSDCLRRGLAGLTDFAGSAFPMSFDVNGDPNEQFIIRMVQGAAFTLQQGFQKAAPE